MHEYYAVIFSNYDGKHYTLSDDTRIKVLEKARETDPYATNHTINLANAYLRQAQQAAKLGDTATRDVHLSKVDTLFQDLRKTADFSYYPWVIAGSMHRVGQRCDLAIPHLIRALNIAPHNASAKREFAICQGVLSQQNQVRK